MDTPDTSTYMIAGFVIIFLTLGVYVLSLYIRNLNLRRDVDALESLDGKPAKS